MLAAILASAYRYGAHRGALDEEQRQDWRDSIPLTRASLQAVIAHGAPSLHGVRRWMFCRQHGAAIQAEVDRAYRLARYLYLTRPRRPSSVRLVQLPVNRRLWNGA